MNGALQNMVSCLNRSMIKVILLTSLSVICPVNAADSAAVIGSFQNLRNAQAVQHRVQNLMSLEASILESEVSSSLRYRVIVRHSNARALVAELKQQGFADAWFLDEIQPVHDATDAPVRTPHIAKDDSRPEFREKKGTQVAVLRVESPAPVTTEKSGTKQLQGESFGRERLMEMVSGIPVHEISVVNFSHADVDIRLDGRVDEAIWDGVPFYDNMIVAVPGTGEPGHYRTETRMIATDRGLYVSAVMYQPTETLVSRMSTRDDFIDRDTFGVTLDTSGEGLMGYWFIVALGDALMDGKVLPERNYQRDWDGPWRGKSARFDEGWSVELFLPWSMMNMPVKNGIRKVGFAVSRQISHADERYQWPGHPFSSSRFVSALNTMTVRGVQPIQQLSAIPFVSATTDRARDDDKVRAGVDLSWKPSPKLELTLSAFPDFGAVEADNVVLNLTAFETFFPEKRLFFLEGNEVFDSTPRANPGNNLRATTNENFATTSRKVFINTFVPAPISLMNTRRIGGTANQVTVASGITPNRGEADLPTDLLGAAKITGSISDFRYGVLGAIEDDVAWQGSNNLGQRVDIEDDGRDFAVARILYEKVGDSRHSIGYLGTLVSGPRYDAVVHGLDMHYTSSNGQFIFDGQLLRSEVDDITGKGALFDLKYTASSQIQHKFEIDYFDETAEINDLGFLRRNDYGAIQYALLYSNSKGRGKIKDIRGTVILRQAYNISRGQATDSGVFWRNSMVFPGRNTLKTSLGYLPARYEDVDSRGNGAYKTKDRWWLDALLATDATRMLSYSMSAGGLQEHLGDWTYNLSAGVTFRPGDLVSVDLDIRYKRRNGWLVYQGGRNFGSYSAIDWQPSLNVNWFMAPGHQLKFSLQWVGVQAKAEDFLAVPAGDGELIPAVPTRASHDFTVSIVTAQLRYRWEIAPLTDFYLVYNRGNTLANQIDSSFSDLFQDALADPIVNSFVVKLRYRFGN